MSDFAEHELHDKVLEAINVDLTVQYLPWSEYAGGKTELMLSTVPSWCAGIVGACMGQGARRFVRCAMHCWNTPESGGTDARHEENDSHEKS